MGARKILAIPAAPKPEEQTHIIQKRKVAGYARVSTSEEEQQNSYEAQVKYYTDYIKKNDAWEFAGMYADEGLSGTSTKHRPMFNKIIEDALAGKIDLILTKSVSRFARNTVDSLTTIRLLKEHGTEVYFEKENIFTFDGKGELLLTIMSSLAQEESRSISENVKWGHRRRFAAGKHSMAYASFLGFDRGDGGRLVVNPEEAKVVRYIYRLFLSGLNFYRIAQKLTEKGFKTPKGKTMWEPGTVKSILTNEKYKGDALLQKTYTVDFLTHKSIENTGQVPQYYIENDHEAIIEPEIFDKVQAEIFLRKKEKRVKSEKNVWSGMVQCGDCGGWYGPKLWHSTNYYARTVYQCNRKYDKGKERCQTPSVSQKELESVFVTGYNMLLDKGNLKEIRKLREKMVDTSDLDERMKKVTTAADKTRHEINAEYMVRKVACRELDRLVKVIENAIPMTSFNEEWFKELCDRIIANRDSYMVRFRGGFEVEV